MQRMQEGQEAVGMGAKHAGGQGCDAVERGSVLSPCCFACEGDADERSAISLGVRRHWDNLAPKLCKCSARWVTHIS